MQPIIELRKLNFNLTIDHDDLVIKYTGQGHPDPATVKPLLEELKQHKQDAIAFLRHQTPATLYQAVSDELAATYQSGTRQYIEQHRPELAQEIDETEAEVNRCWLAVDDGTGTLDAFQTALTTWRQANLKAIGAYNDTLPLTLDGADPDEVARAREQMRRRGYFLMHSPALGERIAVVEHETLRGRVAKGIPVYTLAEIRLLQQGVNAGTIINIEDLRLLHEAKKQMGGVIVR